MYVTFEMFLNFADFKHLIIYRIFKLIKTYNSLISHLNFCNFTEN